MRANSRAPSSRVRQKLLLTLPAASGCTSLTARPSSRPTRRAASKESSLSSAMSPRPYAKGLAAGHPRSTGRPRLALFRVPRRDAHRMPEVHENTTGLAPSALKSLERIYRRRVPSDRIATPELVKSLSDASRETGRQVGALVHRSGDVDSVVVGSPTGLMLPDIGRLRAAQGRFRA